MHARAPLSSAQVAAFHNARDAADFVLDFQHELLVLPCEHAYCPCMDAWTQPWAEAYEPLMLFNSLKPRRAITAVPACLPACLISSLPPALICDRRA